MRERTGIGLLAMQAFSWPLTYHLRAAEMDGARADSVYEQAGGGLVRVADVARGPRPVIVLVDEHLPSGPFDVRLTLRSNAAARDDRRIAFRLTVNALDGQSACMHDVLASKLASTFQTLVLPCAVDRSGPITLTIETAAIAELRFGDIVLTW